MQAADTPQVEQAIQRAQANESSTTLRIWSLYSRPPLTVNDARCIIACLENPRFDTLDIVRYDIRNVAVLDAFRDGLPLCTSLTTVRLVNTNLGNEGLERLLPAFYNTSVRKLDLYDNNIQGQRGGEVLRDLLVGNNTLLELNLGQNRQNRIGPEFTIGLGQGLADNHGLQILNLERCDLGNEGLANLLPVEEGIINNSLLHLDLSCNGIEGADGGQKVSLLLQRFPALKVLSLYSNNLGPLGARALAPGLAAASRLESLDLRSCNLGNDGVANLIPDGQVNTSLTTLNLVGSIEGLVGGENLIALASRCTNLDSLDSSEEILSPDQQHRLDMLLERKRLCTEASALGGSPFSVLFRFVEKAHHHEHGLGAIFVILQNDGDDYFCIANNCAVE